MLTNGDSNTDRRVLWLRP